MDIKEKELSDAKKSHAAQIQITERQLAELGTNYTDALLKVAEAEKALKAKDEELKLKVEVHTACSAALSPS